MPVMDGLEATKKIRATENGNEVKIIGISAHVFKDEIQSIMAVGMDSFVKKTYQFYDIYENLNHHLGLKFIFKNLVIEKEQKPLTNQILEKIDTKTLENLQEAIINLNNEQIKNAINKIQEIDYETAQSILFYTRELKYSEIYRLLYLYLNSQKNG